MTAVDLAPRPAKCLDFLHAEAAYRQVGDLELVGLLGALRHAAAEPYDETDAYVTGERLRAAEAERARRLRLFCQGREVPDPNDARLVPWHRLRDEILARADLLRVLADAGYPLVRAGSNGRRGCAEYGGPCPCCGGVDRFRVWPGPPGAFWCRQCGWSGDVLTVVRNLVPGCTEYGAALRHLAHDLGLAAPDERALLRAADAAPARHPTRRRAGVVSLD